MATQSQITGERVLKDTMGSVCRYCMDIRSNGHK
jgi:hypothetical protein